MSDSPEPKPTATDAGRALSTAWAPSRIPRFSFANERTFLAWIRTGLGFLAAGVAIAAVSRFSDQLLARGPACRILLVVCGSVAASAASPDGSATNAPCGWASRCTHRRCSWCSLSSSFWLPSSPSSS